MKLLYSIDAKCEPRSRLGTDTLLLLTAGGSELLPSAESVSKVEFVLRPVAFFCRACPLRQRSQAFSCSGAIQLPLEPEGEEWMRQLVRHRRSTRKDPERESQDVALTRLKDKLDQLPPKCRPGGPQGAASGTERGHFFQWFEARFRKPRLDLDQLLSFLFDRDYIDPADAELAARALGLWVDGAIDPAGHRQAVFTDPVVREDPPTVVELKRFFLFLMHACSRGQGVKLLLATPERALAALDGELVDWSDSVTSVGHPNPQLSMAASRR